jgi:hypothetical protein
MPSASFLVSFIERLEKAGFDFQADELADILWLSGKMPSVSEKQSRTGGKQKSKSVSELEDALKQNEKPIASVDSSLTAPDDEQLAATSSSKNLSSRATEGQLHKAALTVDVRKNNNSNISYQAPIVDVLPEKLAYSRALRPLTRRIPSLYEYILDEDATIQRIVDEGLWAPVMRPEMTRWLELNIVVDETSSMEISYPVATEFIKLLETLGAFSSIQVWGMVTETNIVQKNTLAQQIRLHAGFGQDSDTSNQNRHPKEIISNPGQGLVIIISDCISLGWYNGLVGSLLETWGEQGTVLLLQTLPDDLWDRTGLTNAIPIQLGFPKPGSSNQNLISQFAKRYQSWAKEIQDKKGKKNVPSFLYLPVASLSPASLNRWAKALAGNSTLTIKGYWLPTNEVMELRRQAINKDMGRRPLAEMDGRERLQRFLSISSPLTQRLAGVMAAIPLSVPVMNLVQRAILPESNSTHMAEFFLGGLIIRRSQSDLPDSADPTRIQYEFWKDEASDFDIRKELLRQLRLDEREQIWLPVGDYIAQHYSNGKDFEAFVTDPAFSRPFALVGRDGLQRRGGKLARLAEEIERKQIKVHSNNAQKKYSQRNVKRPAKSKGRDARVKQTIFTGKICYVIMPFGKRIDIKGNMIDFDKVYSNIIKGTLKDMGLKCVRNDEIEVMSSIQAKRFEYLYNAEVAIVDVTALDANVFYELGIRHGLKKNVTILMRQWNTPTQFNIQGFQMLEYDTEDIKSIRNVKSKINRLIRNGLAGGTIDSPVYDAMDNLSVERIPRRIEKKDIYLYQIKGRPGKEVGVITGDIQDIKEVDVWVNSENTSMQMARVYERSISAIIRYMGDKKDEFGRVIDDTIADELRQVVGSGNVPAGIVKDTTSGELKKSNNVKRIFHAASVVGQPGNGYRLIDNFSRCIDNALKLADSERLRNEEIRSILFPLLGTGNSRANIQRVADELIESAITYLQDNPKSRISKVYFLANTDVQLECILHSFLSDPRIQSRK